MPVRVGIHGPETAFNAVWCRLGLSWWSIFQPCELNDAIIAHVGVAFPLYRYNCVWQYASSACSRTVLVFVHVAMSDCLHG